MASAGEAVRADEAWRYRKNHGTNRVMKAYVGLADNDGLRSFVPEEDVPDGFMLLEAEAAQGRGWACFWAAVDEGAADQVGEELATGRRRDAVNLLCVLARDIVRYPTGSDSHEADSSSLSSPAVAIHGSRSRGHSAGFDA